MEEVAPSVAVFGGGCFWCTEAVFGMLKGVIAVKPGYAGGIAEKPTYEQVSHGDTGHVEVVRFEYDPSVISYDDLLNVFFASHDPTQVNRQGNDVGPQYRSVVFYGDEAQKESAERFIAGLRSDGLNVATTVEPLHKFWPAEDYHEKYYEKHKNDDPYCQVVIEPKLAKVREKFSQLLKRE
ncbi:MAG TPA: peptide-methionine (S)-S-oxide reductase MsrA [Candidatus Paceibacterota bacterium]|nr:peptide-methionine (S)-S-oxide reductase MsrA [Candidatus Paceibacterota bacterium]